MRPNCGVGGLPISIGLTGIDKQIPHLRSAFVTGSCSVPGFSARWWALLQMPANEDILCLKSWILLVVHGGVCGEFCNSRTGRHAC